MTKKCQLFTRKYHTQLLTKVCQVLNDSLGFLFGSFREWSSRRRMKKRTLSLRILFQATKVMFEHVQDLTFYHCLLAVVWRQCHNIAGTYNTK